MFAVIYKSLIELRKNTGMVILIVLNWNWEIYRIYCAYVHPNSSRETMNPEERLKHFLDKVALSGYKWDTSRVRQPPTESDYRKSLYLYLLIFILIIRVYLQGTRMWCSWTRTKFTVSSSLVWKCKCRKTVTWRVKQTGDTELLQSLIFDAEATKLVGKHVKSDKIE